MTKKELDALKNEVNTIEAEKIEVYKKIGLAAVKASDDSIDLNPMLKEIEDLDARLRQIRYTLDQNPYPDDYIGDVKVINRKGFGNACDNMRKREPQLRIRITEIYDAYDEWRESENFD